VNGNSTPETGGSSRELELYFGPQHLGMVGNFSITLKVEGDRILEERAHYIRSIYLELCRVGSHLFGLWAYANMLGFDTVAQWAMYHRDLILDLFEELTGGRVYNIYIWPGGVRRDFPEGFKERIIETLHSIGGCVPDYDATFFNNRLFSDRSKGIGKITEEEARKFGATGQTLRATGLDFDIRKVEPYAAYDRVDWEVPVREDGDAYSRVWVIRDEMIESVHMIFKLLDAMPEGPVYSRIPNPFKWKIPPGDAYVRCESSRGELGLYMVSDGGDKPYRVHFRTPSYTNGLIVLEKLLENASVADVGNIMISLYVVAPEIDR